MFCKRNVPADFVADCVVPENIHTPTTEGISVRPPHFSGISIFKKKYTPPPPPLRNFQKRYVHSPAPLEKVILKRNCANVLNIRPLSLIIMTCVLQIDFNISENDTYCYRQTTEISSTVNSQNNWQICYLHV